MVPNEGRIYPPPHLSSGTLKPMVPGISTFVLLPERLHPGHLEAFATAGARSIEIFAARHHFDYTDRSAIRDLAAWFRSSDVQPALHQPLFTDSRWTRHTAPSLNLIASDKGRRIEAQDEVKRALESAEHIPFRTAVLHLGQPRNSGPDETWSERTLEFALTAIEHLKAFATPLGIRLLLENLPNDVATPAHLLEILKVGHFDRLGTCLNLAHAHLAGDQETDGIAPALTILHNRIGSLHLSDNDGRTDQHLWPIDLNATSTPNPAQPANPSATPASPGATIDWPTLLPTLHSLPTDTPAILEITHELNQDLETICRRFTATQDAFRRLADQAAT